VLSQQNQQLDLEGGCNAAKSRDLEVWGCFRSPPPLPIQAFEKTSINLPPLAVYPSPLGEQWDLAAKRAANPVQVAPGELVPKGRMALSNPHALVSEKNRNPFEWHASKQQLNRKRVTESMCVPTLNFRQFKERLQPSLPLADGAICSVPARQFFGCTEIICFR
jgi:hypothetical protein